jgi:hypothetical protein
MEKLVAKRCPECDGEPQFVHFYIAKEDGGHFMIDENDEVIPSVWLKRLECTQCGATVPELAFTCDEAILYWNARVEDGGLLRKYGTEKVHYVEPSDKIIKLGRIN